MDPGREFAAYDAVARAYAAMNETSPFNALYERPAVSSCSETGNYFATEYRHDRWALGETVFDVHFWRRP